MEAVKTCVGALAITLTFAGWVPYVGDTIQKRTRPHVYRWMLWASTAVIAFVLQLKSGAGIGSFVTLAAGVVCVVVTVLAFRSGERDIRVADTVFLVLALVALLLWLVANQPALSISLLAAVETLAFAPTVRKAWAKPYSETLSSYVMNTVRFGLAIIAVSHYSYVTTVYPLTFMITNGIFAVLLVTRRRLIVEPLTAAKSATLMGSN